MDFLFPPYCFNSLFLGFAFCVVLDFEDPTVLVHTEGDCFCFTCECHFKNVDVKKGGMTEKCFDRWDDRFMFFLKPFEAVSESDHLFLFYCKQYFFRWNLTEWLIERCCNVMEASFEFKSEFQHSHANDKVKLKVKMCGLQLLYSRDELYKCNACILGSKFSLQRGKTKPESPEQEMETNVNKKRSREKSFQLDCINIIADGKSHYGEEPPQPKRVK